jgi:hypothetical protein
MSKFIRKSWNNPRALARCDYSGFIVEHKDLVKQMAYRGRGLVYTGFMVHKRFVDKPNSQDLTPLIKQDPVPIRDPRPDNEIFEQTTIATSVGEITLNVGDNPVFVMTPEQFNNGQFNLRGTLVGDITIQIPNTFNEFYVNDRTEGDFRITFEIVGPPSFSVILPKGRLSLIANTTLSLVVISYE